MKFLPSSPPDELFYVRSFFWEETLPGLFELVYADEGPWDHFFAECVLMDVRVDASVPRGLGRVTVERAILVAA